MDAMYSLNWKLSVGREAMISTVEKWSRVNWADISMLMHEKQGQSGAEQGADSLGLSPSQSESQQLLTFCASIQVAAMEGRPLRERIAITSSRPAIRRNGAFFTAHTLCGAPNLVKLKYRLLRLHRWRGRSFPVPAVP